MSAYSIVLDTNVLFSGLKSRNGASFQIISLIGKNIFALHISVPLVLEYEEKLKEKMSILNLSIREIDDVIDYLCSIGIHYQSNNLFWHPCLKDLDDEMILELGVNSNSDFIVTHNVKDFKMIRGFRIKAITPNDFLKILRQEKYL